MSTFTDIQERAAEWVEDTFGVAALMDKEERAWRLAEELFEYCQVIGVTPEMLDKIRDHVYSREIGDAAQELAGITVSVLAAAESQGINLGDHVVQELTRIEGKTRDVVYVRQNRKKEAGISRY